jgi:alkanesulfonate monooxygenase SsuD/methylene tetrahydromethanopterin reductase-like flavin-dependent oxidoreductase (luciferase family)
MAGDATQAAIPPIEGDPAEVAETLRGFAREGIAHVQLVLDPITLESIRALAPVLVELDRA